MEETEHVRFFFFWGDLKLCLTPENDVNPVSLKNALGEPLLSLCFYGLASHRRTAAGAISDLARPLALNY